MLFAGGNHNGPYHHQKGRVDMGPILIALCVAFLVSLFVIWWLVRGEYINIITNKDAECIQYRLKVVALSAQLRILEKKLRNEKSRCRNFRKRLSKEGT